ncbi:MAG: AAA family ATPase [Sphingomonas sp.]
MNAPGPKLSRGSLLERAASVYDFDAAFRKGGRSNAPAVDTTAHLQEYREPAVQPPVAAPAVQASASTRGAAPSRRVAIDRDRLSQQSLLVPGAPIGLLAEEFRLVKRHLLLTMQTMAGKQGDHSRIILVSSAHPEEGKTFCAINLAISMAAEKDVDVLLVDADFAKADVMKRLGLGDSPGLLDALADPDGDAEQHVVATDIAQLSLLPTGGRTIQDTELLASDRTPAVLGALLAADPRRIIIMDSPPALAASTSATLALHVGQIMMVVRADRTSDGDLREAIGLLDGCDQIQLLLNGVSFTTGSRRFGNYYPQEGL